MAKRTAKKAPAKKTVRPRWSFGKCPEATRQAVFARDGYVCIYCNDKGALEVDHIVPQSTVIDHRPSNLVSACKTCNNHRSVIDVDLYCRHVSRRTEEPWRAIYRRVRDALATPVKGEK